MNFFFGASSKKSEKEFNLDIKADFKDYSILLKESGIPIYQTQNNPIIYDKSPKEILTKKPVDGVTGAFLIDNVLTEDECRQYINITSSMGYEDATVTTGRGMVMMKEVRDNKRVMWQTTNDIWETIWERIKPFMPNDGIEFRRMRWLPYGLNERFRFYRYELGQMFQPHFDGCYPRKEEDCSLMTCIIYLNDGFEGGHTTFFPGSKKQIKVNPVRGQALLFWHGPTPHSPLHEGSALLNGEKYVLRTDVMFRPAAKYN